MKRICRNWLIGLSLVIGTGSVWAQMVPPNLIEHLSIAGIQNWQVVQTNQEYLVHHPQGVAMLAKFLAEYSESHKDNLYYLIKMQVSIENKGDANVLFRDPQLEVSVVQAAEGGEKKQVTEKGETLYEADHGPLREKIVHLGTARLVRESSEAWEPIAEILCPEGTQKARETQHSFEIIVGRRDLEQAQNMIEAFNIMNNQNRKWSLWIRGTAKVGWRGKSKSETVPMIFTSPVEVVLKSKPTLPPYITFPR
jgi:hypothetical protein